MQLRPSPQRSPHMLQSQSQSKVSVRVDPEVNVVRIQTEGPASADELRALEFRRHQLIEQVSTLTDRREALVNQLEESDATSRPGLVVRIREVDERLARLDRDIDLTSD